MSGWPEGLHDSLSLKLYLLDRGGAGAQVPPGLELLLLFLGCLGRILKFMSSLGCLSSGPDTMGMSWHSAHGVCVVFNCHLTGLWDEKWGKKKGRRSFPEQIPQPQAGEGRVGTSQPCSQEAKVMGSHLDMQAVS